jgi:hypothetical protein
MLCSLSRLSDTDLSAIQALEKEINKPLLAFSCQDLKAADLTPEELGRVQELEKRMGISLLAVDQS